jgi:DNA processing protein
VNDRAYWFAWSQISGIGPVAINRLQQQFGSLQTAWEAPLAEIGGVAGIGPQTVATIQTCRSQLDPFRQLAQHEQQNPYFWTPADDDYPRLLLEIPDQPALLYYQGILDRQENQGWQPMVAIVGTREPSDYGKRWTRRLSTTLAQNGFTVVSGMAEGIDTEAHTACLEAGGRTVAILGTGVDRVYPPRNRELYQRILEHGWVASEYPAGTGPDRVHFPRRNRIIAGLSRAVLVLEAPTKSGALITAHIANDYGRDVYVLPGSLRAFRFS